MDKENYYKYMFIISGIYNCLNATIFITVSLAMPDIFPLFGVAVPISNVWLHLSLILIAIFGIGYFIVATNLKENHGIIIIGTISKLCFFVITLIYWILGDLGIIIVLLGSVDILFAILFIEFLFKYK